MNNKGLEEQNSLQMCCNVRQIQDEMLLYAHFDAVSANATAADAAVTTAKTITAAVTSALSSSTTAESQNIVCKHKKDVVIHILNCRCSTHLSFLMTCPFMNTDFVAEHCYILLLPLLCKEV